MKGRPAATLIAAIRAKKPDIEIVNETGEAGLARAVRVLLAKASDHQEG